MRRDETKDSRLRRDWEFMLSADNKSTDLCREKDLLICRLDGSLLFPSVFLFCFLVRQNKQDILTVLFSSPLYILSFLSLCNKRAHTQNSRLFLFALIYILITNAQFSNAFFEERYIVLMTWLEVQGANQPDNSNTHTHTHTHSHAHTLTHRTERNLWLMILIIACIF